MFLQSRVVFTTLALAVGSSLATLVLVKCFDSKGGGAVAHPVSDSSQSGPPSSTPIVRGEPAGYDVLKAVASRLDGLEHRLAMLDQAAVPAPKDDQPAPHESPRPPSEIAGNLDAVLRSEKKDEAWDGQFRERARRALSSNALQGVTVLGIQCGSTMCRMDMQPPPNVNAGNILVEVSEQGLHGGIWYTTDDSVVAKGTVRMFVAREHEDLALASMSGKP